MAERVTIEQQIREVEGIRLSREAQIRQRQAAINAGKAVPPDTGCITSSMPILEAALRTLCWVRDHADVLRTTVRHDSQDEAA
jgi:hypothetical protein